MERTQQGKHTDSDLDSRDICVCFEHLVFVNFNLNSPGIAVKNNLYFMSDKDGNQYTFKQVAELTGRNETQAAFAHRRKGILTIEEFMEIPQVGGKLVYNPKPVKLYETPFGRLSHADIVKRHEFFDHKDKSMRMTRPAISGRLSRRGGMCPSLWWEKMKPAAFWRRLVESGIESIAPVRGTATNKKHPTKIGFNRSKACYRNNHMERCVTYMDLTESFCDVPACDMPGRCEVAEGCSCVNYVGEPLAVMSFDRGCIA